MSTKQVSGENYRVLWKYVSLKKGVRKEFVLRGACELKGR